MTFDVDGCWVDSVSTHAEYSVYMYLVSSLKL